MIPEAIYLLCALTCWACAILMLRAYGRHRSRLLFWSGCSFSVFGISNVLLFVDLIVIPDHDLSLYRGGVTLFGVLLLLWGLVWEGSS